MIRFYLVLTSVSLARIGFTDRLSFFMMLELVFGSFFVFRNEKVEPRWRSSAPAPTASTDRPTRPEPWPRLTWSPELCNSVQQKIITPFHKYSAPNRGMSSLLTDRWTKPERKLKEKKRWNPSRCHRWRKVERYFLSTFYRTRSSRVPGAQRLVRLLQPAGQWKPPPDRRSHWHQRDGHLRPLCNPTWSSTGLMLVAPAWIGFFNGFQRVLSSF